jgi:hypothetical protein
VGQVDQNLDALQNDIVGFLTVDIGDKANAASIVLVGGVIEPLAGRKSGGEHSFPSISWTTIRLNDYPNLHH